MQFYYGEQNLIRALDEAEFWKHQEAEHTTVIPLVTPGLEQPYLMKFQEFGNQFHNTHSELVKYTESVTRSKGMINRDMKNKILTLIKKCLVESQQFIEFLENLLKSSEAVKANSSSQTVIHHIIRESQYFIGIDQLILS